MNADINEAPTLPPPSNGRHFKTSHISDSNQTVRSKPILFPREEGFFALKPKDLHELWLSFSCRSPESSSLSEDFEALRLILDIRHYETNPRSSAYMNFMFDVLCFAKSDDSLRSKEKVARLLSYSSQLFEYAVSMTQVDDVKGDNPGKKQDILPNVEQLYQKFRAMMCEAARPPPVSVVDDSSQKNEKRSASTVEDGLEIRTKMLYRILFSVEDVSRVVKYMTETLFHHLKAYQYVFTYKRDSVQIERGLYVETPISAAALCESTQVT